jgi:hypothetical protein
LKHQELLILQNSTTLQQSKTIIYVNHIRVIFRDYVYILKKGCVWGWGEVVCVVGWLAACLPSFVPVCGNPSSSGNKDWCLKFWL